MDQPKDFFDLLPLPMKVSAKTIGLDLPDVVPMGATLDLTAEVRRINRGRKIEAVVEGKPYEEMMVQDHPDYRGPSGSLFYLDYSYGATPSASTPNPYKPGGRRGPKSRTDGNR
jgi:hypothetical protein